MKAIVLGTSAAVLFWVALACIAGFGHYEDLPPQCPDATRAPRPPPNPQVTRFELNHVVVDDPPVRCYIACSNCTNPAIACVVLP